MKPNTEKQRLLWIIDFINQDIDNLPTGDFLKLLVEAGEMLDPKGTLRERIRIEASPSMRSTLKSIQDRLRTLFEKIYRSVNEHEYGEVLRFEGPYLVYVWKMGAIMGRESRPNDLEYEVTRLIERCSPEVPISPDNRLVTARNLQVLKKCKVCNNFFWQAYKMEKNYCSTKCAWVANSRARREEGERAKRRKEAEHKPPKVKTKKGKEG